jgi:hypothetical protein
MLTRLIYASETSAPLAPAAVQELLAHARRNNDRRDITGMLVFNSRHFLQVLEGDRQRLSDLYGRLVQDTRHQRLLLLSCEAIGERLFADWHMGFAAVDAASAALYRRFSVVGRLDPQSLTAPAAVALLLEFSRRGEAGGEARGAASAAPAHAESVS